MGLAVCESYLTQFLDPLLELWLCAPTKVGTAIIAKKQDKRLSFPHRQTFTGDVGYQQALHLQSLLELRGLFRPVPYLAYPLYLNSISGNGIETRDTISAGR